MAVIGRPPVLRSGEDYGDVGLHRGEVEALEFGRVVEFLSHRVDLRGVLVEDSQVQLLGPPVLVRHRARRGVAVTQHRAPRRGGLLLVSGGDRAGFVIAHGAPPDEVVDGLAREPDRRAADSRQPGHTPQYEDLCFEGGPPGEDAVRVRAGMHGAVRESARAPRRDRLHSSRADGQPLVSLRLAVRLNHRRVASPARCRPR